MILSPPVGRQFIARGPCWRWQLSQSEQRRLNGRQKLFRYSECHYQGEIQHISHDDSVVRTFGAFPESCTPNDSQSKDLSNGGPTHSHTLPWRWYYLVSNQNSFSSLLMYVTPNSINKGSIVFIEFLIIHKHAEGGVGSW